MAAVVVILCVACLVLGAMGGYVLAQARMRAERTMTLAELRAHKAKSRRVTVRMARREVAL